MSSKYNLNELAGQDYFEFILDDLKYIMSYPSSKDVLQLQEVMSETEDWQAKVDELTEKIGKAKPDEQKELTKKLEDYTSKAKLSQESFIDWCVGYIKPEVENSPDVKEVLMAKNIKYMLAFIDMIKTELKG